MSGNTGTGEITVPIVYENMESKRKGKDHLLEIIDGIEKKVESLRMQASYLEEEKDGVITALDTIRQSVYVDALMEDEKEEIAVNLERLTLRVSSVEVTVRTNRDQMQEEALSEVNDLINRMVVEIDRDIDLAKTQCLRFLNTCASDPESGPIDKGFENALLGCTIDDQKRVRRRLSGLMDYLDRISVSML